MLCLRDVVSTRKDEIHLARPSLVKSILASTTSPRCGRVHGLPLSSCRVFLAHFSPTISLSRSFPLCARARARVWVALSVFRSRTIENDSPQRSSPLAAVRRFRRQRGVNSSRPTRASKSPSLDSDQLWKARKMDATIERECSALGGLFQQIITDMKVQNIRFTWARPIALGTLCAPHIFHARPMSLTVYSGLSLVYRFYYLV